VKLVIYQGSLHDARSIKRLILNDMFHVTHIPCSCLQHTSFISSYCSKLAFTLL